ncbi:FkbM family methyltransferase [Haloarcula salina]|uniref:FkbM family methyltransferase n=1 Tax=Haloarcula salina TaxID=1429914 RepID=A0AA41G5B6_9EURY|nr:FkbM family methyltransferase [Haloarcula salina]MBV0900412.1 FkbM family methyltransferase [Haloarcula salina]
MTKMEVVRDIFQKIKLELKDPYSFTVDSLTTELRVIEPGDLIHYQSTLTSEQPVYEDFVNSIENNDIVWDIGANLGIYGLLATETGCDVSFFEPHPESVERIFQNIAHNEYDATVYEAALSNESGTVDFVTGLQWSGAGVNAINSGNLAENYDKRYDNSKIITVDTQRADAIRDNGATPPTVAKIDVEGAEMDVLLGGPSVFDPSTCRLIYCEVHSQVTEYGYSMEDVRTELAERGYSLEMLGEEEGNWNLKATADQE